MTRPCGCGGTLIDTCNCVIQPAPGGSTTVSGTGTPEDPYLIGATGAVVQALDTDSIDMTVSGAGTPGSPYQVSGAVRRVPGANLLTETASGLLVACAAVQDCVAEAIGPGLFWNLGDRRFEARISPEPGNLLFIADDGGLYASTDGSVAPPQPRGRVFRSTNQLIPTGAGISTAISFDTELEDTAALFNPAQPTRLTAPVAGGYTVGAGIEWQSLGANANSGDRLIFLRKNGTETLIADRVDAARSVPTDQSVSTCVTLAAGDYIEVLVRHVHPVAINVTSAVNLSPIMFMFLTTEGA